MAYRIKRWDSAGMGTYLRVRATAYSRRPTGTPIAVARGNRALVAAGYAGAGTLPVGVRGRPQIATAYWKHTP